ncbi:MAG: NAD+ synthase [Phycisphaerae bacterium]|nr:NAD+ synthase [Phycisphaerae bacterium]
MRIALAQTNPTIGAIADNSAALAEAIDRARNERADLVIFPELSVIGYPPKDLLLKQDVIGHCEQSVRDLAARCTDIAAIIGYPCVSDRTVGQQLYNAAAFCAGGQIAYRHVKSLLPTYDVFDETRYFEPASDDAAFTPIALDSIPGAGPGVRLGISICEDLWNDEALLPRQLYDVDPVQCIMQGGANMLVNCSASPFVQGKHGFRLELAKSAAMKHNVPVIYCNQVGGNDELVFDGNSFVMNAAGEVIAHAKSFDTDLLIADLPVAPGNTPGNVTGDASRNRIERDVTGIASIYNALVLGLRDYCRKCGFGSVVVGLSGGIDSAVVGAICVGALGNDNVRGVTMPSRYSSQGSIDDARALAQCTGIEFHVIPITEAHDAFEHMLAAPFEGLSPDVTEENVQARIRGVILMAMSNKFGSLLVTTGNKSELAVGYCTLYGDMAGGLAVLSDVPKTMVWELARWINDAPDSPLREQFGGVRQVIPESSITKAPSAELRPDQTDQDSLPPYDVLDQIVERYVEREQPLRQIIADTGFDAATVQRVARMIDVNEYKRKQAAPGLKVTGRAFGFGRRMPIAQRYDGRVGVISNV